jgi:hypothetical protein
MCKIKSNVLPILPIGSWASLEMEHWLPNSGILLADP